jgi:hypothetical protein
MICPLARRTFSENTVLSLRTRGKSAGNSVHLEDGQRNEMAEVQGKGKRTEQTPLQLIKTKKESQVSRFKCRTRYNFSPFFIGSQKISRYKAV